MAITGVHTIIYTSDPEAVRRFFAEVLGLPSVDAGGGWLIFALPPGELAAHPADPGEGGPSRHQLYLMCDDIRATVAELTSKGVEFSSEITDAGWGLLTAIRLPDGQDLGLYEPRHPTPLAGAAAASS